MGTATIGSYTLNSVVDVKRDVTKQIAEHQIPGAPSIMQATGRKRDQVTITGILNPTSEIATVQSIMATLVGGLNTATFAASAVTDYTGTDWVGFNNTVYFLDKVSIQTQKGATVPWGKYTVMLKEVGP